MFYAIFYEQFFNLLGNYRILVGNEVCSNYYRIFCAVASLLLLNSYEKNTSTVKGETIMKTTSESLEKTTQVIKNTQHIEDSIKLLRWVGEGVGDEGVGDEIINQMLDPILVIDAKGKFVFVNKAASSLYGYTKQELLTMYIWNLNCVVTHEQICVIVRKIFDGETLKFETTHRGKTGTVFSIEIHSSKIHLECCEYVLAVCRDITERKKLEERLKIVEKENEELQAKIIRDNYMSYLATLLEGGFRL